MKIRIQNEDFDPGKEIEELARRPVNCGALASFIGIVRGDSDLKTMTLEHYPAMTEREIARHVQDAQARWPVEAVTVIHRVGRLKPGERIVLVAVMSRHRTAAFETCQFLVDYLKTKAPLWKLEEREGAGSWVEAREEDDRAAGRWTGR